MLKHSPLTYPFSKHLVNQIESLFKIINCCLKSALIIIVLITFSTKLVIGQEQLNHPKKIYVSEDQKIYVNKSLPVYFRISTSPDGSAPSYLLPSETTPKYANPMYLDTEGRNTFHSPYAVDTTTKKLVLPKIDVQFQVYADGIAPVTRLKLKGAKLYTRDGNLYAGEGLSLDLTSTDAISGVDATYMSVNHQNYLDYAGIKLNFNEEKDYVLKYYSVDHVGNVEPPKILEFKTDLTAPVTMVSILGESQGKVLSTKAAIKLAAADTLSGVDKIYYAIDNGPKTIYTAPIPISVLKNETTRISYYAVDKVGNQEEPKVIATSTGSMKKSENESGSTFSYYIDKEPPVVNIEIEGDKYSSGTNTYISARSKVKIIADDEKSGVDKILYSIDNGLLKDVYKEPFGLPAKGLHTIYYAATDNVGNFAMAKSQKYILDDVTPSSKVICSGPRFVNRDTTFITKDTKISLVVSESGSGVKVVNYTLDSQNMESYTSPIYLQENGFHTIKYQAVDNVNNEEPLKTASFLVDNIAPKIHYNFSVRPIGEKTVRDEKYDIYPSNTMLYIAATDNSSGGEKIEYRINGQKEAANVIPLKGLQPGNYEIEITAWDVLKNKSTEIVKFAIEN